MSKTLYKCPIKDLLPEEKHIFYTSIFDEMTPTERRIAEAYAFYQDKITVGDWKELTIARIKIAKRAKCSESSVRNYIAKYEGLYFTHETRRKNAFKHDSNKYYINIEFYEVIKNLQYLNYFHRWDEVREEVINGLFQDPHFLCAKVARKFDLSTSNLPTVFLMNLPAIKSYLNSSLYTCRNTRASKPQESLQKKKRDSVFGDIPLTYAQKTRLLEYNALADLKEARLQYDKYVFTWGNKVMYPYSFIEKQTEKNRYIRKNGWKKWDS